MFETDEAYIYVIEMYGLALYVGYTSNSVKKRFREHQSNRYNDFGKFLSNFSQHVSIKTVKTIKFYGIVGSKLHKAWKRSCQEFDEKEIINLISNHQEFRLFNVMGNPRNYESLYKKSKRDIFYTGGDSASECVSCEETMKKFIETELRKWYNEQDHLIKRTCNVAIYAAFLFCNYYCDNKLGDNEHIVSRQFVKDCAEQYLRVLWGEYKLTETCFRLELERIASDKEKEIKNLEQEKERFIKFKELAEREVVEYEIKYQKTCEKLLSMRNNLTYSNCILQN